MKKIFKYFSNQKILIKELEKSLHDRATALAAAMKWREAYQDSHKLLISQYDGKSFLSIVDTKMNVTSIIQIPALKYHELRKAGVQVIDKNILND